MDGAQMLLSIFFYKRGWGACFHFNVAREQMKTVLLMHSWLRCIDWYVVLLQYQTHLLELDAIVCDALKQDSRFNFSQNSTENKLYHKKAARKSSVISKFTYWLISFSIDHLYFGAGVGVYIASFALTVSLNLKKYIWITHH